MMIGSFIFNETSSESFNLVSKSIKRPLLPAMKVRRVELVGASGVYDFSDNEYSPRSITMRVVYIGSDYTELRSKARQIAGWLGVNEWCKLVINDESDKYYLAKVTDEIALQSVWEAGSADITFDCQPFAYSVDEENLEVVDIVGPTAYEFTNPGTRLINYKSPQGSKFNIILTGAWTDISLSMNGAVLHYYQAANGILTIDNIEMEASLDGVNKFNVLTGDVDTFLKIVPGVNTLTISGTDLDVVVNIDYVPLWL